MQKGLSVFPLNLQGSCLQLHPYIDSSLHSLSAHYVYFWGYYLRNTQG